MTYVVAMVSVLTTSTTTAADVNQISQGQNVRLK